MPIRLVKASKSSSLDEVLYSLKASKSNSFAGMIFSRYGSKLYTCVRGSCRRYTPGLNRTRSRPYDNMGTGGLSTSTASNLRSEGYKVLIGIASRSSFFPFSLFFLSPSITRLIDRGPSLSSPSPGASPGFSPGFFLSLTACFLIGTARSDLCRMDWRCGSRVWLRAAQNRQTGVLCHSEAGDSWRRSIGGSVVGKASRWRLICNGSDARSRLHSENVSAFVNAGRSLGSAM